jgi:hypothetical protein
MTLSTSLRSNTKNVGESSAPRRDAIGLFIALALIGLTIALQAIGEQSCDVAWFITFAERVLDGAMPYVDIADPNTPAAWLIYMPAVLVARLTGVSPEAATTGETILLALAAIGLAGAILRRAGLLDDARASAALCVALFACLVAWGPMLGQRENFAAIAVLPGLAAIAARAARCPVSTATAITAGCLGALAVAIKPHYALALLLPAALAVARQRSLRPLIAPENLAVAAVVVAYGIGVAWFTPAYFTHELPQIAAVYADARFPLSAIASSPLTLATAATTALICALALIRRDPRLEAMAAAAAGFFAAYVIQGKMPTNHALPAIAMALIGFGLAFSVDLQQQASAAILRRLIAPAGVAMALVGGVQHTLFGEPPHARLAGAVAAVAPANATIGGINYITQVSFPLVRKVGGRWVNSENALWAVDLAQVILATKHPDAAARAQIDAVVHAQRQQIAKQLSAAKPDVIVIDDADTRRVELATPELGHALDSYRHAIDVDGIEVWVRAASLGAR